MLKKGRAKISRRAVQVKLKWWLYRRKKRRRIERRFILHRRVVSHRISSISSTRRKDDEDEDEDNDDGEFASLRLQLYRRSRVSLRALRILSSTSAKVSRLHRIALCLKMAVNWTQGISLYHRTLLFSMQRNRGKELTEELDSRNSSGIACRRSFDDNRSMLE